MLIERKTTTRRPQHAKPQRSRNFQSMNSLHSSKNRARESSLSIKKTSPAQAIMSSTKSSRSQTIMCRGTWLIKWSSHSPRSFRTRLVREHSVGLNSMALSRRAISLTPLKRLRKRKLTLICNRTRLPPLNRLLKSPRRRP